MVCGGGVGFLEPGSRPRSAHEGFGSLAGRAVVGRRLRTLGEFARGSAARGVWLISPISADNSPEPPAGARSVNRTPGPVPHSTHLPAVWRASARWQPASAHYGPPGCRVCGMSGATTTTCTGGSFRKPLYADYAPRHVHLIRRPSTHAHIPPETTSAGNRADKLNTLATTLLVDHPIYSRQPRDSGPTIGELRTRCSYADSSA